MTTRKIIAFLTVLALATFASCSVESENIFNMFDDVKITFHNDSEYAVTDYRKYNDGDSVHISFTITSATRDMMKLVVDSTIGTGGANGKREFTLNESQRRSYSGRLRFKIQRDGRATFRIYALDDKNVYMGDGYKSVTIEGAPSYTILADRKVYRPNPNKPELPTFYAIGKGKAYTYAEGQANAADIDFGIYSQIDQTQGNFGRVVFNMYAISTETNPYPAYDLSNWEKRQTLFSAPVRNASGGGGLFNAALVSSSRIEEEAKKQTINQTITSFNEYAMGLNAGSMLYFLTPEGKYGAILINQSTVDAAGEDYLSISTKIQH
ncbi:hypothetical protein [Sphingobacterium griseoflavum]|uniref:Uncharacterized protein n=1 Tax=Sphingobacterium griseoflavum TaxID=1474952 RepID=A0ABQ3HWI9_9SPHI|nr:hypothetical protein [Sphingobacterium griseoflavum]GHE41463.1 hypothetical protein GCM10017764_26060 [Sphingobacterium griseoflavum]